MKYKKHDILFIVQGTSTIEVEISSVDAFAGIYTVYRTKDKREKRTKVFRGLEMLFETEEQAKSAIPFCKNCNDFLVFCFCDIQGENINQKTLIYRHT